MSLAVMECKESKEAELERVVEYRGGWLYMDYKYRGKDLEKLNVVEYADKCGMPVMRPSNCLLPLLVSEAPPA
jgi:hypothetical protein